MADHESISDDGDSLMVQQSDDGDVEMINQEDQPVGDDDAASLEEGEIREGSHDASSSSIGFDFATPSRQSSYPAFDPMNPPVRHPVWNLPRTPKRPGTEIKKWKKDCLCPFTCHCPKLPELVHQPKDCRDHYAPETKEEHELHETEKRLAVQMSPSEQANYRRLRDFLMIDTNARQAVDPAIEARFHHEMRNWIVQVRKTEVTRLILARSDILKVNVGLRTAFIQGNTGGYIYHIDIKEDCARLYFKWSRGDYDPNLMRGIVVEYKHNVNGTVRLIRKLDKTWPHRERANFEGSGHLFNGDWWPFLMCLVRDGAHGAPEAGIYGTPELGAVSIVLSCPDARSDYADIDMGEVVYFVGTWGKKPDEADGVLDNAERPEGHLEPSKLTQLLFVAFKRGTKIRVIRCFRMPSAPPGKRDLQGNLVVDYRPEVGFRFDGLYIIESYETLRIEKALYRFKLVRRPGQGPIRARGPGMRSDATDAQELKKIRADEKLGRHLAQGGGGEDFEG